MRKIIVGAFVSVDGVMQAPGGPEEDPTGGFEHGGWVAGYFDQVVGEAMGELFGTPYDLLLGRKTYDIFAEHWPHITDPSQPDYPIAEQFNRITKYVATHRPESLAWKNSRGLGPDPVAALRELKKTDGPNLLTQGSSEFLQTLFAHDLVDELRVLTFPIVLGKGKRLFASSAKPVGLRVLNSKLSPNGVVITSYVRAGEVKTGSFALEKPTPEEIERRKNLR
ncbi:Dihydrofolate reductase [Labilithrix luteola]|uniref:Dihydrofolate reductase n=1 Tax=Labilithrix luteola TaxID=1391654 RepID=A0A0K1PZT9_9BACT|nr:dihydrofolate reductase family protein [Labilithrix luteola]AKU99050.1 Dihydrofolate reductase [Labilithrix luteola]